MPLGLEDGRVLSGSLRASSSYNYKHGPDRARLNIHPRSGRIGAWVARYRNTKQWLEVDLGGMSVVKGIATQGRRGANQWVSSYSLSSSRYGRRFKAYAVGGAFKVRRITRMINSFHLGRHICYIIKFPRGGGRGCSTAFLLVDVYS